MKRIIALALVLVVFMFATTIATATISIPEINIDQALSTEKKIFMGDPIDGGPPGRIIGAKGEVL
ncbi:MAG: hypothetical protein ACE5HG_02290 [Candidatus Bathyarchaeia archaeon]